MSDDSNPPMSLNPLAMSVADFGPHARAMSGRRVTTEQVMADLEAGAPSTDGRINLVFYTAWFAAAGAAAVTGGDRVRTRRVE